MSDYSFLIKSYERVIEEGKLSEEGIKSVKNSIAGLKVIDGKSEEEIQAIFGTGAFNNICIDYVRKAMNNVGIDKKKTQEVIDELSWLFDVGY